MASFASDSDSDVDAALQRALQASEASRDDASDDEEDASDGGAEDSEEDDELRPEDLAAIDAFVGGDNESDAASMGSDSSAALARAASQYLGDVDDDVSDDGAPPPQRARAKPAAKKPAAKPAPRDADDAADAGAGAPVDKQAKCKARRQRQRERAKAKQKERKAGPAGQAPTLFVRAFNGELDRRELTKLAEASLGGGVVTKVRAVGEDGGTTSVYIELQEGTPVREAAQKLHKKQLANGAQLSVKPALDKAGLEDVVRKKGKRKEPEPVAAPKKGKTASGSAGVRRLGQKASGGKKAPAPEKRKASAAHEKLKKKRKTKAK